MPSKSSKSHRLTNALNQDSKTKDFKINESLEEQKNLWNNADNVEPIYQGDQKDSIVMYNIWVPSNNQGSISTANDPFKNTMIHEYTSSDLLYDIFWIKPKSSQKKLNSKAFKIKLLNKQFEEIVHHTNSVELYETISELKKKISQLEFICNSFQSSKDIVSIHDPDSKFKIDDISKRTSTNQSRKSKWTIPNATIINRIWI